MLSAASDFSRKLLIKIAKSTREINTFVETQWPVFSHPSKTETHLKICPNRSIIICYIQNVLEMLFHFHDCFGQVVKSVWEFTRVTLVIPFLASYQEEDYEARQGFIGSG